MESYYYVGMTTKYSRALEEIGKSLTLLARKCNGKFSGTFKGSARTLDFGYIFKTERSARKFYAELGKRVKSWKISDRFVTHWENDDITKVA